jgi:C-terminal processing protease CtpA/Prc
LTIIRGNTNDPHVVELTREATPTTDVTNRIAAPGVGYVRIAAFHVTHDGTGKERCG